MHIAIVAPIATEDLLPSVIRQNLGIYPKGYEGAPLVSALIKEYTSRGIRVLAITTDTNMNDDEYPFIYNSNLLTFVVVPSRLHTFRFNGKKVGRVIDFYKFERQQIIEILKQYRPDIVHAHWSYEFAMAALQYTPTALITIHDNPWAVMKYMGSALRLFRLLMAHYVFYRGRRFTTISPYMAQAVQRFISTPIDIIPNPLTTSNTDITDIKNSSTIISAIMNGWDKRKNGEQLLLAFKEVQEKHTNVILWAMGTAFEAKGPAAIFCQKHFIKNVIFLGKLPHTDILNRLSRSHLLLHTSLEESFGMVLIEAMSYGVPVVAGKFSGAVPWVVQDGGLLVDVTDTAQIAAAVDLLLTNRSLHNQLATEAYSNVRKRFSAKSVADQYIQLYRADEAVTDFLAQKQKS